MGIFSTIMDKIFHYPHDVAPSTPTQLQAPAAPTAAPAGAPAAPASTARPVDVAAVLETMASAKGGGGNYQTSIVDLLKLLDMDSSLTARKALANELNVHVGADGTAEENIALHKAVMRKLEENGGKAPDSLKGRSTRTARSRGKRRSRARPEDPRRSSATAGTSRTSSRRAG